MYTNLNNFDGLQSTYKKFYCMLSYLKRPTKIFFTISVLLVALALVFSVVGHALTGLIYVGGPAIRDLVLPALAMLFAALVPAAFSPITALLYLLGLFVTTALIYVTQGAEYLALVFLIVYVGGLAIIFLFVIMLINVKEITSSQKKPTLPSGVYAAAAILGVVTFIRLSLKMIVGFEEHFLGSPISITAKQQFVAHLETDILALRPLFGEQWPLFALITAILLISMLGAIIVATTSIETDESRQAIMAPAPQQPKVTG